VVTTPFSVPGIQEDEITVFDVNHEDEPMIVEHSREVQLGEKEQKNLLKIENNTI
jgi:hypothetical protein